MDQLDLDADTAFVVRFKIRSSLKPTTKHVRSVPIGPMTQ